MNEEALHSIGTLRRDLSLLQHHRHRVQSEQFLLFSESLTDWETCIVVVLVLVLVMVMVTVMVVDLLKH
jgi:hypothetical protein